MSHSEQPATRMTLPMSMSQGTKEGIGTNQWTTACFVLNKLNALCDGNPPNVQKIWPDWTENLCSSHWGKCKFCDLDTWLQQSGPCLVAYPIVSVATKELSESVLLAVSIAPEKVFLSQRHCVQIWYCSQFQSSLATCHPVQRRPNMRVADCATVSVCKCPAALSWSYQLQSLFRFCMIDYECWSLKLKTQIEFWKHFYSC